MFEYQPLIASPNVSIEPTVTVSPVFAARCAQALRNEVTRSHAVPSPTCTPLAVMTAGSISVRASTLYPSPMNWALNPPFSLKVDGMAFMRYFFTLLPIAFLLFCAAAPGKRGGLSVLRGRVTRPFPER